MKYLIVGLGNTGAAYAHTRHNIGFDVVDALVRQHGGSFRTQKLGALAQISVKGRQLICLQPDTFMNLSGKALKYWLDKESIPLQHLLVVLDDLALPLNKLRLRPSGSHAGHNGLRSIEAHLHTNQYPRLRFGIGNDYPKGGQADFVLGHWKADEQALVQAKINQSVKVVEDFVFLGLERTMSKINNIEISVP